MMNDLKSAMMNGMNVNVSGNENENGHVNVRDPHVLKRLLVIKIIAIALQNQIIFS